MSDGGREPLIRLPVDQEVFMESVQTGDSVEDATVATEVVSFERADDVYQLEGAVVFAGFVRRPSSSFEDSEVESDQMETVQHVHYRLPFVLRVPISAQPTGIVNVKSRLSGFTLTVSADHWLAMTGSLEVHGLSGDEGYHFRCGGQEYVEELSRDFDPPNAEFRPTDVDGGSVEDALPPYHDEAPEEQETDFAVSVAGEDWRHAPPDEEEAGEEDEKRFVESEKADDVSVARAGHGWADSDDETESMRSSAGEGELTPVSSAEQEEVSPVPRQEIRNELTNLDRFFTNPEAEQAPQPEVDVKSAAEKAPVASFEFEHQVDPEAVQQSDSSQPELEDVRGATEKPKVNFAASVVRSDDDSEFDVPIVEEDAERHESAIPSVTDRNLWSFVDFNGPEPRYTMRYVIAMEEETVETIADRCGCLPSELQRVNPWLEGPIAPGQALYIPNVPITLPKLSAM